MMQFVKKNILQTDIWGKIDQKEKTKNISTARKYSTSIAISSQMKNNPDSYDRV